jgi:uncharacterized metal-binding protein
MNKKARDSNALQCECKAEEIVLLPCSGASNCGQIANHVAVKLTEDGYGTMYCLAGIGAHDSAMIEKAKAANRIVAIDGCSILCAKRTLEHAGLRVTDHFNVNKEGIKKTHDFNLSLEDISSIAAKVRERLGQVTTPG